VLLAGLALSVFQLIYVVLEYRTTKDLDAKARVSMLSLYRLSLKLPVARLLARKSSAKALLAKSSSTRDDKVG
jgi:hypothetical protein